MCIYRFYRRSILEIYLFHRAMCQIWCLWLHKSKTTFTEEVDKKFLSLNFLDLANIVDHIWILVLVYCPLVVMDRKNLLRRYIHVCTQTCRCRFRAGGLIAALRVLTAVAGNSVCSISVVALVGCWSRCSTFSLTVAGVKSYSWNTSRLYRRYRRKKTHWLYCHYSLHYHMPL